MRDFRFFIIIIRDWVRVCLVDVDFSLINFEIFVYEPREADSKKRVENKLMLNLTVPSEYPVASNFMSNSISISVDNDFVNIISVVAAAAVAVRVTVIISHLQFYIH